MKNHAKFLTFAVLVLALGTPSLKARQATLSLAEAASRALEHNPELAIDAPGQAAARMDLKAGRAGYLPRIDFEQSLTGGNNPVYVFGTLLTQQGFGSANFALDALNSPDPVKNLQTRFTAQQTIYDFGRTSKRVESARLGIDSADLDHEEHVRQVLLATCDAYYSVSLAHSALETARTSIASAEAFVQQAQARVSSGLAVEADLLRGQVHLAVAHQQEIEAQGRREIARASLNRLMGAPLDSAFGDTAALVQMSFALPAEDELRAEQLRRRPDYQRMLADVRRAELEAGSRKSDLWPVLGAFGTWEIDNPSLSDYGGNNWGAGISLRWNLFAGGADTARLQAARHRLEQSQRQSEALASSLALQVHQALIEARTAAQQVEAMRAIETQSQESLRILQNRYEAGLATMTDLLAAETSRAAARTALAGAIYRYRVSYARLEYAAGTLSLTSASMKS